MISCDGYAWESKGGAPRTMPACLCATRSARVKCCRILLRMDTRTHAGAAAFHITDCKLNAHAMSA